MTNYAFIQNEQIIGKGICVCTDENTISYLISDEVYYSLDHYIWDGSDVVLNPNYDEEQAIKERQRLDALTLTPADVERALYKEKQMDFDDLKALIAQQIPQIDTKALSIEFRAKDFFRGAMYENMRLFDVVGALLGYTPADMDYLFEHKELPVSATIVYHDERE